MIDFGTLFQEDKDTKKWYAQSKEQRGNDGLMSEKSLYLSQISDR